ncbi:MAG: SpoIIE family protein phosphatase [Magnetococcales bacterium]|nr:SpoIIE family protein phosphatase [Magnetococcales bacterium]
MGTNSSSMTLADYQAKIEELEKKSTYFKLQANELLKVNMNNDAVISSNQIKLKQKERAFQLLSTLQSNSGLQEEPGDIIDRVLKTLQAQMKMTRSIFFLRQQPDSPSMIPINWLGYHGEEAHRLTETPFPKNSTINRLGDFMLSTKKSPIEEEGLAKLFFEQFGIRFFICVPVVLHNQISGILLTSRVKEAKPFYPVLNEGDVETLKSISSFLAMTLENRDLYSNLEQKVEERTLELSEKSQALEEARAEMEEDLKLSAQMQMSLQGVVDSDLFMLEIANLPYRGWVGGDGVSFCQSENGDYWLRVSDGTGHGSSGGTAEIVDNLLFTEVVKRSKNVKQAMQLLVETINDRFPNANLTYAYFLAKISSDGQVEYINARQLALHLSGPSKVETLVSQPLIIGHREDSDLLEPHTLTLNHLDSIMIATDGIFEARSWNERRNKLTIVGKQAVVKLANLAPMALLEQIKEMEEFEQNDDILLVKLTRNK